MKKILVMSREKIEQWNSPEKENIYIVSITDPDSVPAKINQEESKILRLEFYDIDFDIKTLDGKVFHPMNNEQARAVVTFLRNNYDNIEAIIVHCEAGISRSAGVAAAIAKHYNGDDSAYFRMYLPNRWCYKKMLENFYEEEPLS